MSHVRTRGTTLKVNESDWDNRQHSLKGQGDRRGAREQ
jgi:hypothetical protein